jgi:hypothetical protein
LKSSRKFAVFFKVQIPAQERMWKKYACLFVSLPLQPIVVVFSQPGSGL